MKKLLTMVLAVIMVFSLGTAVMAEEAAPEKVKLGVQMYNFVVGGDWGEVQSMEDLEGLLTKIAEAGYDGVEWCNFQLGGEYLDLDQTKSIMDELGLETAGMHFHFGTEESLADDAKLVVERCQALNTNNLIFAYSTPALFGMEPDESGNWTPEQIDEWAGKIDMVLAALKEAAEGTDIRVIYHNHNTEFLVGSEGKYLNDMIAPEGLEVDVYWASKGMDGKVASALDYVRANIDHVYLLHVKDGLEGSVFTGEMCGWGKGTYDIQSIVDTARESDTIEWVIVENDAPYNFLMSAIDDAAESAAYAAENINFVK